MVPEQYWLGDFGRNSVGHQRLSDDVVGLSLWEHEIVPSPAGANQVGSPGLIGVGKNEVTTCISRDF